MLSFFLLPFFCFFQFAIQWETCVEHDFGVIKYHTTHEYDFRFRNAGDAPVLVETVRTECGCTVPQWSDHLVAPNETGSIHVEFDAKDKGRFRKKITVFFDGQRKPETLWVVGEIE